MKTFFRAILILEVLIFSQDLYSFHYVTKKAETLDEVAKKFHINVKYLEYDDYIVNLKKWNNHIPDFNDIPSGTQMYVVHPHCHFLLGCGYDSPLELGGGAKREMASKHISNDEEQDQEVAYKRKKHERNKDYYYSLDLIYTAYQRKNKQNMEGELDYWKSTQNSPITIESVFVVIPKRKNYYYEIKAGISYLMPSDSSIEKKLPNVLEYRGGAFLRYRLPKFRAITVKGGFHYRHHVNFDLGALAQRGEVKQYNYEIGYMAAGAGYRYEFNYEFANIFDVTLYRSFIQRDNYDSRNVDSNMIMIENMIEYRDMFFGGFYQLEKSRVSGNNGRQDFFGIRIGFTPF